MTKFNENISGQISTLLSDIIPVYEATPQFMQDQAKANVLSDNLTKAQQKLAKNDFKSAKAEITKALNAYHDLSKEGICFSDSCDMDVDLLKKDLKKVNA